MFVLWRKSACGRFALAPRRLLSFSIYLALLLLAFSAQTLQQTYRLDQSLSRRSLATPAAEWLSQICPRSQLEVVREFPLSIVATADCSEEVASQLEAGLNRFYEIQPEKGEKLLLVRGRPPFAWEDHRQLALSIALFGLLLLLPGCCFYPRLLLRKWQNRPVKPASIRRRSAAPTVLLSTLLVTTVALGCLPLWVLLAPLLLAWRSLRARRTRQQAGLRSLDDPHLQVHWILESYPAAQSRRLRQLLGTLVVHPSINRRTTWQVSRARRVRILETFAYHLERHCRGQASDDGKIAQTLRDCYLAGAPAASAFPPPRLPAAGPPASNRVSFGRWFRGWLAVLSLASAGIVWYSGAPLQAPLARSLQAEVQRLVAAPAAVAVLEREGQVSALVGIDPRLNSLVLDRAAELGLNPQRVVCLPLAPTSWTWTWVWTLGPLGLAAACGWHRHRQPARTVKLEPAPPPVKKPRTLIEEMQIDEVSIEVGRGLLGLVEPNQGAKLVERVASIRRYLALELGLTVPAVGFRDNLQLKPNIYVIKIRDCEVARGELQMGQFLAIGPEDKLKNLRGLRVVDPTYGMPGVWVSPEQRGDAERLGCMIFDCVSVVSTQVTEAVRNSAPDLLTYKAACSLLDQEKVRPLVSQLERYSIDRRGLWLLLRALLEERVSIRDLERICESLLAVVDGPREALELLATARQSLARSIAREYTNNLNQVLCWEIPQELQNSMRQGLRREETLERLHAIVTKMKARGLQPILLSDRDCRRAFALLPLGSGVVVLAACEIPSHIERVAFSE